MDDGPSSTVWRGNSRMGAGSCAVADDADWRRDSGLIELLSMCRIYSTRREIEREEWQLRYPCDARRLRGCDGART